MQMNWRLIRALGGGLFIATLAMFVAGLIFGDVVAVTASAIGMGSATVTIVIADAYLPKI